MGRQVWDLPQVQNSIPRPIPMAKTHARPIGLPLPMIYTIGMVGDLCGGGLMGLLE
jgi:hypothetical protein